MSFLSKGGGQRRYVLCVPSLVLSACVVAWTLTNFTSVQGVQETAGLEEPPTTTVTAGSDGHLPVPPQINQTSSQINILEIAALDGLFWGAVYSEQVLSKDFLSPQKFSSFVDLRPCVSKEPATEGFDLKGAKSVWNPVMRARMELCQSPAEDVAKVADHINLLTLDAEGVELHILDKFDYSMHSALPVCAVAVQQYSTPLQHFFDSRNFSLSATKVQELCEAWFENSRCMLGSHIYIRRDSLCDKFLEALELRTRPATEDAFRDTSEAKAVRESRAQRNAGQLEHWHRNRCKSRMPEPFNSNSQGFEDLLLMNHFWCGQRNGVYLEIGALDGRTASNTLSFQNQLGWTGVLIEANPSNVEQLLKNRPGKPTNTIIPMAVCAEGLSEIDFIGHFGGVGGAVNALSQAHLHRWTLGQPYKVKCKPLGTMLRDAGVDHIDLFSLDVEGSELTVLKTMDWSIPVCVWMVENDGLNPSKEEDVRKLLSSNGYVRSLLDFRRDCHGLKPNQRVDCLLENEIWEHADLSCGIGRTKYKPDY